jgi:hypothetical protein
VTRCSLSSGRNVIRRLPRIMAGGPPCRGWSSLNSPLYGPGDDWSGFRDVHEVDGKPVADRRDRLERLFSLPAKSAIPDARRINDESARYNLGAIQRNFNTPTMALFFLERVNHARFTFKKEGQDRIDGATVWKIRYEGIQSPPQSSGKDMPVSGIMWVDPIDGPVLKTHMSIETEVHLGTTAENIDGTQLPRGAWTHSRAHASASVTVTYKSDPRLGFLVPSEMLETYEGPRPTTESIASGTTRSRAARRIPISADLRRTAPGHRSRVGSH